MITPHPARSTKTEAKPTSSSRTDNQQTVSSGPAPIGNGSVLFSCPLQRTEGDVSGAETSQRLSVTREHPMSTATVTDILISEDQVVTLCVCHAMRQSGLARCCALDADNRVITYLPVWMVKETGKSAGAANPQKKGNGSSTAKSTGKGKETRSRRRKTGSTGRSKSSTSRPGNG